MAVDHAQYIYNNNTSHNNMFIDASNIDMMKYYNNNNNSIAAAYGATTVDASFLPPYACSLPKSNQDDSGLTYAIPSTMHRKRPRNHSVASTIQQISDLNNTPATTAAYSFLGDDVSGQILQQQLDVDRCIYRHMEKVRMEVDERRRRNSRRMIEAVEEGIRKRLKAKEDEIEKVERLNWALEERVRSLSVENQIWRELAQSNEATANALRSDLEQVLATAVPIINLDDDDDDAESCCGSSAPDLNRHGEEDAEGGWRTVSSSVPKSRSAGVCRRCGKAEADVVLRTCRHLCLCVGCGSTRTGGTTITCPVCKTVNNATLLVNLSS